MKILILTILLLTGFTSLSQNSTDNVQQNITLQLKDAINIDGTPIIKKLQATDQTLSPKNRDKRMVKIKNSDLNKGSDTKDFIFSPEGKTLGNHTIYTVSST